MDCSKHMQVAEKRSVTSGPTRRACHMAAHLHDQSGNMPSCTQWVMNLDADTTSGPDSPRPFAEVYNPDDSLCFDDFGSCSNLLTTSHSTSSFFSGAYGNVNNSSACGNTSSSGFGINHSSAFGNSNAASASWSHLPAAAMGSTAPPPSASGHVVHGLPRLPSLENALDALTAVVTRHKLGGGGSHNNRARRSLDVLLDEAGSPCTISAWWACPVSDPTPEEEEEVVFQDLD